MGCAMCLEFWAVGLGKGGQAAQCMTGLARLLGLHAAWSLLVPTLRSAAPCRPAALVRPRALFAASHSRGEVARGRGGRGEGEGGAQQAPGGASALRLLWKVAQTFLTVTPPSGVRFRIFLDRLLPLVELITTVHSRAKIRFLRKAPAANNPPPPTTTPGAGAASPARRDLLGRPATKAGRSPARRMLQQF